MIQGSMITIGGGLIQSGGGSGTLVSKTITQNGVYDPADDNADGYSSVTVNVSGGSSLVKIMEQGQISTTSNYATAYFDSGVDITSYEALFIDLYRDGVIVGSTVIKPESNNLDKTLYIYTDNNRYAYRLTSTSITCTYYNGDWANLYVDVYGFNR